MMIPYVTLADPRAAMTLYEKALGATTVMVMDGPDGSVMHAEMQIGGQQFMLGGVWPGMSTGTLRSVTGELYVVRYRCG